MNFEELRNDTTRQIISIRRHWKLFHLKKNTFGLRLILLNFEDNNNKATSSQNKKNREVLRDIRKELYYFLTLVHKKLILIY